MANVDVVQGDTALTPDQGPTSGSLSIETAGVQTRQAAATARMALLDEAAKRLGAAKEDLVVVNGAIGAKSGGRYAHLCGADRREELHLKVDPTAPTKSPDDYKVVGKPIGRLDIPRKLTG